MFEKMKTSQNVAACMFKAMPVCLNGIGCGVAIFSCGGEQLD